MKNGKNEPKRIIMHTADYNLRTSSMTSSEKSEFLKQLEKEDTLIFGGEKQDNFSSNHLGAKRALFQAIG